MRPVTPPGGSSRPPSGRDWRLEVWRLFLRSHAQVTHVLEEDLLTSTAMSLSWYDVLVQLAEAPERRLRMAQLADRVLLSRSGLTRLVERIEREGYVRRVRSPDDARGTLCVLTRQGYEALQAAAPIHLRGVSDQWLARFSDDELRVLARLLSRTVTPSSTRSPHR